MTNDLRYRGLVTIRRVQDGVAVAEYRTNKSYLTGTKALNEAEMLSFGLESEIQTADIAVENVKVVSVCKGCDQLYNGIRIHCVICGGKKMMKAEMEVMF